ncbi:TIGR03089 family protein [Marmoricola sp. URHA0025 HA25]
MTPTTFPDLLARRLTADPGQPLVTFYDDASGERTELSVKTFANWVSKTANLYADELMLDPGDAIRIDLPVHWLGPVFLGAAWSCGLELAGDAEVAIVGPDGVESGAQTTIACSLTPFATRFTDPLPPGVLDHGVLWPGQSDVFSPTAPTRLDVPEPDNRRVLTDLDPLLPDGRALFLGLLAGTGSLVLVAHPDVRQWPAHSQSERATGSLRTGQPTSW